MNAIKALIVLLAALAIAPALVACSGGDDDTAAVEE